MVESALVLPLVVLFFLAIFQLALLGTYRFTAEITAQGMARCRVVGAQGGELLAAGNAMTLATLGAPCLVWSKGKDGQAEVSVILHAPLLIPGLSAIFGTTFLPVKGRCMMILEPE